MDPTTLDVIDAGALSTLKLLAGPILDILSIMAITTLAFLAMKAALSDDLTVIPSLFELAIAVAIIQVIVRGMPLLWDALRQFGEVIAGAAIGDTLVTPTTILDILFVTLTLMFDQIAGLGGWLATIAALPLILLVVIVAVIIIIAYGYVFYVLVSAYIKLGWSAVATVAMSWMSIMPQLRFATKNGLASMIASATQILVVSLMTSFLYNAVKQAAAERGELTLDLVWSWALAAFFTLIGALTGKEIADSISRGGPEMGSTLVSQAGRRAQASMANAGSGKATLGAAAARASGSVQAMRAALGARNK